MSYASVDAGAFSLNDWEGMQTQDATIQGSQMLLRSALSYDAAARASNGKKAFAKASTMIVENMVESMAKRIEAALFYGQSPTGIAKGTTGADVGSVVLLTVDDLYWAPGNYQGLESGSVTIKVGAATFGPYEVVSVDYDTREIGLATRTTSKGQDAGTGALVDIASQVGAIMYFFGSISVHASAPVFREMLGLENIISTSGVLFNVDNTVYGLWKGNVSNLSGPLTIDIILEELSKPIAKGLDEDVSCFVNPDVWADLATDLAALRQFDSSYDSSKGENGVRSIQYYSQNGKIDIISSSCVKVGHAFIIPTKRFKRIGAIDVTFKTPGREEEIFFNLPDNAGFELRAYTDQALFPESVAKCLLLTGITS